MKAKIHEYQGNQYAVGYHAMVLAHSEGASFTAAAFCARFGHKLNRHTRRVLNEMVADGVLCKAKTLFEDGHYRMVYHAQRSGRMVGF